MSHPTWSPRWMRLQPQRTAGMMVAEAPRRPEAAPPSLRMLSVLKSTTMPAAQHSQGACLSLDTRDPKITRPRVPITDERDTTPDRLTDELAFKRLVSNLASRLANTPA